MKPKIKLSQKTKQFLIKNGPTILSILGCVGVVGTGVTAAVLAPKASKKLQEVRDANGGVLTFKDAVKAVGSVEWPAMVTGAATIGCIIAADRVNAGQKAQLTAALGATLLTALPREKQEVPEKTPRQEKCNNLELFYEEHYGYFWANPYDIIKAVAQVYQDYSECGFAYLSSFFYACGIDDDKVKGFALAGIGWNYDYVLDKTSVPSLDIRVVDSDDTLLSPDGEKYHVIEFSSPLIYNSDECIWNSDGSGKSAVLEA